LSDGPVPVSEIRPRIRPGSPQDRHNGAEADEVPETAGASGAGVPAGHVVPAGRPGPAGRRRRPVFVREKEGSGLY